MVERWLLVNLINGKFTGNLPVNLPFKFTTNFVILIIKASFFFAKLDFYSQNFLFFRKEIIKTAMKLLVSLRKPRKKLYVKN